MDNFEKKMVVTSPLLSLLLCCTNVQLLLNSNTVDSHASKYLHKEMFLYIDYKKCYLYLYSNQVSCNILAKDNSILSAVPYTTNTYAGRVFSIYIGS